MQRTNLYPSPLTPLTNDGKNNAAYGSYDMALRDFGAGTYVFSADIANDRSLSGMQAILYSNDWKPLLVYNNTGHVKGTFTLDKAQRIILRANLPGVRISNIIIESESTYDAGVGGGGFQASSPATPCHSAKELHRAGDVR